LDFKLFKYFRGINSYFNSHEPFEAFLPNLTYGAGLWWFFPCTEVTTNFTPPNRQWRG